MALTKVEADGINLGFFGDSQTWQNMGSSRAAGTYYTNSTGKPIMVFVIYTDGTNADIDFHYTPAGGSKYKEHSLLAYIQMPQMAEQP